MDPLHLLAGLLGVGAVLLWYATVIERVPMSPVRVAEFAHRQRLTITAANGNQVIRYLAVTRRWRSTGLVLGYLITAAWALRRHEVRLDSLGLLAGWFTGALGAELRLIRAPSGPRRAASLIPRVRTAYLPRWAWWLVPVAGATSVAVGAVTVLVVLRGHPVAPAAWLFLGLGVLVAGAVMAVQRTVLRRPRSGADPDLVAADDAIRTRSSHVLAGGGMSVVLYCVLGQLVQLLPALPGGPAAAVGLLATLGVFVVPVAGVVVANAPWPARGAPA